MSSSIKGFDELEKQLKQMQKSVNDVVEKYNGKEVSFDKIFTVSFMKNHTSFTDFDAWLSAGNFIYETQEDFENIDETLLDEYVSKTTDFDTWQDMLDTSGAEFFQEQLDF